MSDERIEVRDNPTDGQFEIWVDDVRAGLTQYSDAVTDGDGVRTFPHTEVDEAFGGRGLATTLIQQALDATRAASLLVRPLCPAVARFIDKHPDYADLVAP